MTTRVYEVTGFETPDAFERHIYEAMMSSDAASNKKPVITAKPVDIDELTMRREKVEPSITRTLHVSNIDESAGFTVAGNLYDGDVKGPYVVIASITDDNAIHIRFTIYE
jgi:hypothetical protein